MVYVPDKPECQKAVFLALIWAKKNIFSLLFAFFKVLKFLKSHFLSFLVCHKTCFDVKTAANLKMLKIIALLL